MAVRGGVASSVMESTSGSAPLYRDICGWCGKRLLVRTLIWRQMASSEGRVAAANFCPQTRTESLDPAKKGKRSQCDQASLEQPDLVLARLDKFLADLASSTKAKRDHWSLPA